MAKKVIKKKKLKILPFLTFIIVIAIIVFSCLLVLNSKVRNIIITGNEILSDDDIISLAGLTSYPSFYKTLDITMAKKIKQNKIINKVTITREFYHTIVIKVKIYSVAELRINREFVLNTENFRLFFLINIK